MNNSLNQPGDRTLVEQGDPAADNRAFRRCLGLYPTGVTVVTARHGDRLIGMAVNSFAAVSLDPPLVLWSIRRESRSLPDFLEASHFGINILAHDQVETSQLFGAGHPERFSQTPWQPGVSGVPLLERALGHLECRRTLVYEGGDHLILVGQVERYARFEGEPLLFSQGQYAVSQTHPQMAVKSATAPVAAAAGVRQSSFLKVLSETHQRMSSLFDEHRKALGVTQASTRILTRLDESPSGLEELERATYLGKHALDDSLADLVAEGCVRLDTSGVLHLTDKGRLKREAVAERSAQFTQEKLQGITEEDVSVAQRVLLALQLK
jgi:flavin reductase (DIM6/NTAB) family NADH-FMN oxidoreductase RutF/DNA-binding MarR family transcriptional regulator